MRFIKGVGTFVVLSFFFSGSTFALDGNTKFIKKVADCVSVPHVKEVMVLKQWHLSPGVNTHTPSTRQRIPQTDNQLEIYRQLEEWIKAKKIDTVMVEGCEGEITDKFKPVFYGWNMTRLKTRAKQAHFNTVLAHPGMKLKVQFKNKIKVLCGDSMAELKAGDRALSDARGDVGYLSRLTQHRKEPQRAKIYLEGVIESFHLSPKTSIDQAMRILVNDIKKSLGKVEDSIQARNLSFVKALKEATSKKPIPVIIGGLHADHLKQQLETHQLNCSVFEPVSYEAKEEELKQELSSWLKKH